MNRIPLVVPSPRVSVEIAPWSIAQILDVGFWVPPCAGLLRFHLTLVYTGTGELSFYVHGAAGEVHELTGGHGRLELDVDMHTPTEYLRIDVQARNIPGKGDEDASVLIIEDPNVWVEPITLQD
jgi:hypothetical protein